MIRLFKQIKELLQMMTKNKTDKRQATLPIEIPKNAVAALINGIIGELEPKLFEETLHHHRTYTYGSDVIQLYDQIFELIKGKISLPDSIDIEYSISVTDKEIISNMAKLLE